MISFTGRVVTGRGEAAAFTQLDWVRDGFINELGIDPYPGTVNLIVDGVSAAWSAVRSRPGIRLDHPSGHFCGARCYPVRLDGWLPAGIVVPEVAGYPPSQVELISALPVRQTLAVTDGGWVSVATIEPFDARAVLFDVDGTLVDSLNAFRIVAELAAAPYGVTITEATVREALNTTQPFWELALPADWVDRAATLKALTRDAARLWPAVLREHGRVVPDVGRVLHALRDRGVKLGIVTGSRRGSLEALRDAGLLDVFDAVVTGEDVQRRKPDPEGIITCLAMLQVEPSDAIYAGDTPLDVRAAQAAGLFAVGVLGGAADSAMLAACGPNRVVKSVARLLDVIRG
jgi:HAD superfamily hydrolase (TIGR01509 family)